MSNRLLPSEALYLFAGWLTRLETPIVLSARHDASIAAELVGEFCEANQLEGPRDDFPIRGVVPETRPLYQLTEADLDQPLAVQEVRTCGTCGAVLPKGGD